MRNTLKILGIICIIAAALFVAACGDLTDPVTGGYTVTFDSAGGSNVPSQNVDKDIGKVSKPPNPTKTELTDPGLYKNFTAYTFKGWANPSGAIFDFDNDTITGPTTLTAVWEIPEANKVPLPSGADDNVTKTFTYLNASSTTIADNDKYTLYIDSKITPAAALTLTKANANLTIIGKDNNSSEIKSPNLSTPNTVFITIGVGNNPTTTSVTALNKTVSLTLKNVAVVGSKTPTPNSLIRVMNGATLTLDNNAYIAEHINSAGASGGTNTSNGALGNGAAICVINGSTLNIKQGAIVEKNESTGTQANKNLVGGIYVIGTPANNPTEANKNRSTVNIEGGSISGNKCTDGNTADIYITEYVNLNLQGNVTIGELCINTDDNTANSGTGYARYEYPNFTISGPVTNTINKLNLRSSTGTSAAAAALTTVQGAWTDKKVFSGTADYDISQTDVNKFLLWEFTGSTSLRPKTGVTYNKDDPSTWANLIDPAYKIDIVNKSGTTPNYGKLVKVAP